MRLQTKAESRALRREATMSLAFKVACLALCGASLTSGSSLRRPHRHHHHKRTRREAEQGLERLESHVSGFRQDVDAMLHADLYGRETKKMDAKVLKEDIHELRSTFDELDKDTQEDMLASRLSADLSKAFEEPKRKPVHRRPRHEKYHAPAREYRGFDTDRWADLGTFFKRKGHASKQHYAKRHELPKHHRRKHGKWVRSHQRKSAKRKYREVADIPMIMGRDRCGAHIPISQLGLKRALPLAAVFGESMLLQTSQDPSYAHPGSGVDQTAVDNGRSIIGNVEGVEPFVKVFKDGYFLTTCAADTMFTYGDKFGDNKVKYKFGTDINVSIVLYDQMVIEEEQKPMTAEVCYDFCRTLPDMVFFGLIHGRTCYCTPYWKPSAEGSGACDLPCEGGSGEMCGGDSKSSIYEMHLCADTAEDLQITAADAEHVLMYFYENADQLKFYDESALKAGQRLMKVAGAGGDPIASDLGMMASKASGVAAKLLLDGECVDAYTELLTHYNSASSLKDADFGSAENLEKADTAIQKMKELTPTAEGCGKKAEEFNVATQPWYVEYVESLGDDDGGSGWWDDHLARSAKAVNAYKPLLFVVKSSSDAKMSTCGGDVIGYPKVMYYQECAEACDATVYPVKCQGFQHFGFGSGGEEKALCYLFKGFDSLTTYECDFLNYDEKYWASFVETRMSMRRDAGDINCDAVAESMFFRGSKCTPAEKDSCGDLCDKAKGATLSASCNIQLAALSGSIPNIKIKHNKRCFGADDNSEDSGEITLDVMNEVGGTAKFGAAEIEEPTLWTE